MLILYGEIREILQEHQTKQGGMFTKQKNGIRPDIKTSSIAKVEA